MERLKKNIIRRLSALFFTFSALLSCDEDPVVVPRVPTFITFSIDVDSLRAKVPSDVVGAISESGFCWSADATPLVGKDYVRAKLKSDGSMVAAVPSLDAGDYHFRAYVGDSPSLDNVIYSDDLVLNVARKDIVPFADGNFKAYCVDHFDTDGDGEICFAEAKKVMVIVLNTDEITSLEGIKYFSNLQNLTIRGSLGKWAARSAFSSNVADNELPRPSAPGVNASGKIKTLDLGGMSSLTSLLINCNVLETINLQGCTGLESLSMYYNRIQSLDLSDCRSLKDLIVGCCLLSSLDLSHNLELKSAQAVRMLLKRLDLGRNSALTTLKCGVNELTSLDVSGLPSLENLWAEYNTLEHLDVSHNPALQVLECGTNQLTGLDVRNNPHLTKIGCENNRIGQLDITANKELSGLSAENNYLEALDLTHNESLTFVYCARCFIDTLDVSHNSALQLLDCSPMPSLRTLWLKTGQRIQNINVDRNAEYIPESTIIEYR